MSETTRQYIFFDLGWTFEDETESQRDRAAQAVVSMRKFGVGTSVEELLAYHSYAAGLQYETGAKI